MKNCYCCRCLKNSCLVLLFGIVCVFEDESVFECHKTIIIGIIGSGLPKWFLVWLTCFKCFVWLYFLGF